jgi:cyclic-di-GMP-binding biofilm dispersal mediator protein
MLAGRDQSKLRTAARDTPGAEWISFDLRYPRSIEELVESTVDRFGRLDGIVNAAGVVAFGPVLSLSDRALEDLMEIDLIGPLRLIRSALPHLNPGFVVNLTGVVAEQPMAGMAAYSAAKAGLSAASVALARELRRQKVLVMDVRAPHSETGLASRSIEGAAPRLPSGITPEAVAKAVVDGIAKERRLLRPGDFQ